MVEGQGIQMTSIVKSAAEMIVMVEQWHTAMLEKGWS
jgi:hypothetical protein